MSEAIALLAAAALAAAAPEATPLNADAREWTAPVEPFRISSDIFYVGFADIAVYLVSTDDGLILIDTGFAQTADQVLANVRKLGFDQRRIRLILLSQAHDDHVGAVNRIKALTGARVAAGAGDAGLLARGGRGDPQFGDSHFYPPVRLDRKVGDGDQVRLGRTVLTAHATPGHTPGCTTWTLPTEVEGRKVQALFLCGVTAPGYRLVGNRAYPNVLGDFRMSFQRLSGLKCELFLGAHGGYFGLTGKRREMARTGSTRVFVDPEGCRAVLAKAQAAVENRAREQGVAP